MNDDNINKELGELQQELSKVKSANDMIDEARAEAKETIEKSREITDNLIKESKQTITNLIKQSGETADNLIEQSEKATGVTIKESKNLNKNAKALNKNVETLVGKLDKVDFPIRLDKIDTSVSNIIGAQKTLETNLTDRIKSQDEKNKDILKLAKNLENSQKTTKSIMIAVLIILSLTFVLSLLNLTRYF